LALSGLLNVVKRFEPYQPLATVSLGKAGHESFAMFVHAFGEVARDASVDRSVLPVRHDVDVAGLFHSLPLEASGSWAPAFAGEHSRCNQQLLERPAQFRWAWADRNSSRFHRRDLALGVALAARDDRAGMAHAATRGCRAPGDEPDDRLAPPAFRLVGEELGGILLGAAADLADHDDRLGLVVGKEHLEHVDELGALDRVAPDADRGRLA